MYKSRGELFCMEQNMRLGLVPGRFAVLKILDWAVKYATFEGNFLCFHGQMINVKVVLEIL